MVLGVTVEAGGAGVDMMEMDGVESDGALGRLMDR